MKINNVPAALTCSTFAIAVIIHWIVFQTFVFTLHLTPVPNKPAFIFLGSILSAKDFQNLTTDNHQALLALDPILLKKKREDVKLAPFPGPKKPNMKIAQSIPKKSTLKMSFEETKPKPPTQEDYREILGVDLEIPKRVPLKLFTK